MTSHATPTTPNQTPPTSTSKADYTPHSHRYRVTDTGLRHALFLTRAHNRLLRDGLAEITGAGPGPPPKIRTAARAYEAAIDDLLTRAGLAA